MPGTCGLTLGWYGAVALRAGVVLWQCKSVERTVPSTPTIAVAAATSPNDTASLGPRLCLATTLLDAVVLVPELRDRRHHVLHQCNQQGSRVLATPHSLRPQFLLLWHLLAAPLLLVLPGATHVHLEPQPPPNNLSTKTRSLVLLPNGACPDDLGMQLRWCTTHPMGTRGRAPSAASTSAPIALRLRR